MHRNKSTKIGNKYIKAENNSFIDFDNFKINFYSSSLNSLYEKFVHNQNQLWPADTQLEAEVELLKIHIHHKMPLEAFGSIMSWATKLQLQGCNYSKNNLTCHGRDTVLNDIMKWLHLKSFDESYKPKFVEWLPDKCPTIIYVQSAIDAIFPYYQIWIW